MQNIRGKFDVRRQRPAGAEEITISGDQAQIAPSNVP